MASDAVKAGFGDAVASTKKVMRTTRLLCVFLIVPIDRPGDLLREFMESAAGADADAAALGAGKVGQRGGAGRKRRIMQLPVAGGGSESNDKFVFACLLGEPSGRVGCGHLAG